MKFMLTWKVASGSHKAAAQAFLKTGAPAPEGLTLIGRWHAPGSGCGWGLVEATDAAPLALHATEWGQFLEIQITPVVEDDVAGKAFAQVYAE